MADIRSRVTRLLEAYHPAGLKKIDTLLAKYTDDPEGLVAALVKRYGPEPEVDLPQMKIEGMHLGRKDSGCSVSSLSVSASTMAATMLDPALVMEAVELLQTHGGMTSEAAASEVESMLAQARFQGRNGQGTLLATLRRQYGVPPPTTTAEAAAAATAVQAQPAPATVEEEADTFRRRVVQLLRSGGTAAEDVEVQADKLLRSDKFQGDGGRAALLRALGRRGGGGGGDAEAPAEKPEDGDSGSDDVFREMCVALLRRKRPEKVDALPRLVALPAYGGDYRKLHETLKKKYRETNDASSNSNSNSHKSMNITISCDVDFERRCRELIKPAPQPAPQPAPLVDPATQLPAALVPPSPQKSAVRPTDLRTALEEAAEGAAAAAAAATAGGGGRERRFSGGSSS
eukprot:Rhum_TRINITY_DN14089_c6_g1::Rhum_TRINITY_DN14089_c6_g1_i1::g.68846::m.68846